MGMEDGKTIDVRLLTSIRNAAQKDLQIAWNNWTEDNRDRTNVRMRYYLWEAPERELRRLKGIGAACVERLRCVRGLDELPERWDPSWARRPEERPLSLVLKRIAALEARVEVLEGATTTPSKPNNQSPQQPGSK